MTARQKDRRKAYLLHLLSIISALVLTAYFWFL